MSDLILRDGTGTSRRAKVNTNGQLHVRAITTPRIHQASDGGNAYMLGTTLLTLGGVAEHNVLYGAPSPPEGKLAVFDKIRLSWNGGDTNHDRALVVRLYADSSAPTANKTTVIPANLNFGSANLAPGTYERWDGVGTSGMTVASQGTLALTWIISQGMTIVDFDDSIILPKGSALLLTVEGEEVGKFSVNAVGYIEET